MSHKAAKAAIYARPTEGRVSTPTLTATGILSYPILSYPIHNFSVALAGPWFRATGLLSVPASLPALPVVIYLDGWPQVWGVWALQRAGFLAGPATFLLSGDA